jgi:hypothetical protein
VGALCALLAVGPVHAAPGEAGSGKKAPAPGSADLIDDLTIEAPSLTPPPSVKAEHLETLDPKAAAKAKAAKAKAEKSEEKPAGKPADKSSEKSVEKSSENSSEKSERSSGKSSEKSSERSVEKPVDKPGDPAPDTKDPKADDKSAAAASSRPKKTPTADAPWLERSKALLELTSKTEGATVYFDGKELGKTPLEPTKVLPGTHELKLTKEGMADSTRTVRLKTGGKLKVTIDLRPPPVLAAGQAPAPLHVDVIDDEPKPEEDDGLPPPLITASGDLAGPGMKVGTPLKAAPAAAVSTEPAPQSKALVRQWWFWGAVAAGAVVLAAGVVYALPPQYAEKRDPLSACGGTACGVVINK